MEQEILIEHTFPPNWDIIRAALPHANETHTFCYGHTIYVPDGHDLLPDIVYHEQIHMRQQGSDPQGWWIRYCTNERFRLSQELEAYGEQYRLVKDRLNEEADRLAHEGKRLGAGKNNLLKWSLERMARALSGEAYGSLLSLPEAESKIRRYAK